MSIYENKPKMADTIFKYYIETKPVLDWLHTLYSIGANHGSVLVETWLTADNVAQSCRVLDALVDADWIIPNKTATPSREMVFFGVGGRAPGTKTWGKKWRGSHTYACEFGYTPNLDNKEFMTWVHKKDEK